MRAQEAVALIEAERQKVLRKFEEYMPVRVAMDSEFIRWEITNEDREFGWTEWLTAVGFTVTGNVWVGLGLIPFLSYGTTRMAMSVRLDRKWGPRIKEKVDALEAAVGHAHVERAKVRILEGATAADVAAVNAKIEQFNNSLGVVQREIDKVKALPFFRYIFESNRPLGSIWIFIYTRMVPFEAQQAVDEVVDAAMPIVNMLANKAKEAFETPLWVYGAYSLAVLGLVAFIIVKVK